MARRITRVHHGEETNRVHGEISIAPGHGGNEASLINESGWEPRRRARARWAGRRESGDEYKGVDGGRGEGRNSQSAGDATGE